MTPKQALREEKKKLRQLTSRLLRNSPTASLTKARRH